MLPQHAMKPRRARALGADDQKIWSHKAHPFSMLHKVAETAGNQRWAGNLMPSLGTNNTNQSAQCRCYKVKIIAVIAHGSKTCKLVVRDTLTLTLDIAEPLQYRT
jgi:hypothetical protein